MKDLSVSDMLHMQRELYEAHKNKWAPLEAKYAKESILWMMEEVGECIAVIKKKGDQAIMEDQGVRQAFCEEMSDVLMYFHDALLRYDISADEISTAYSEKHKRNMHRNYMKEYEKQYQGVKKDEAYTDGSDGAPVR